jgi:hypothetical protein
MPNYEQWSTRTRAALNRRRLVSGLPVQSCGPHHGPRDTLQTSVDSGPLNEMHSVLCQAFLCLFQDVPLAPPMLGARHDISYHNFHNWALVCNHENNKTYNIRQCFSSQHQFAFYMFHCNITSLPLSIVGSGKPPIILINSWESAPLMLWSNVRGK